jgi:hypothetical protein
MPFKEVGFSVARLSIENFFRHRKFTFPAAGIATLVAAYLHFVSGGDAQDPARQAARDPIDSRPTPGLVVHESVDRGSAPINPVTGEIVVPTLTAEQAEISRGLRAREIVVKKGDTLKELVDLMLSRHNIGYPLAYVDYKSIESDRTATLIIYILLNDSDLSKPRYIHPGGSLLPLDDAEKQFPHAFYK